MQERRTGRAKARREPIRLSAVAGQLADHGNVAWDDLEGSAESDDQRAQLCIYRAIARIAGHQREWQRSRELDGIALPGRLADFELLREIGRGSMGVVYEARQIGLDRRVALKVLSLGFGRSREAVARFRREAQTAAKLHHTNIVPVFTTGEHEGCHYFAMELVEGRSLRDVLSRTTTAETDTGFGFWNRRRDASWFTLLAELIAGIADALHHAHQRGVVHRDVKPANLLLSNTGVLCLTDFGVARLAEEPGLTATGAIIGTPAYMAPEQVLGARGDIDARTDIFSLGGVLYECLTAQRAFCGDSRESVIQSILTAEPVRPRRLDDRIPADLENICLKALEKEPRERYETAEALAEDLRAFARHDLITARRNGPLRRLGKAIRRNPPKALAAGATCFAILLALIAWQSWQMKTRSDAAKALSEARLSLASGDYRSALRLAGAAIDLEPDLADARVARARAALMLFQPEEVERQAQELLTREPDDWRGRLILAMLSSGTSTTTGWGSEPIDKHLAFVERMAPETADAYYLRAIASTSDANAIALLDSAIELDHAHADALFERAVRHASLTEYPECLLDCERLIVARPRSAEGHILKGRVLLEELRDVAAASSEADRAVQTDPNSAQAFVLRGAVREIRREYEPALTDYRHAIKLQPFHPRQRLRLSQLLLRRGRAQEAVDVASRGVELFPRERDLYDTWFRAEQYLDRTGDALAVADRLQNQCEMVPTDTERAECLAMAAELYRRLERWDQAIAAADSALDWNPQNYGAYTVRAAARRAVGDESGYRADCEAAVGLEIEQPAALADLSMRMCRHCRFEELARMVTDQLVERFPQWPQAWHSHAFVRGSYGDHEGAVASYRKAVEIAPEWAASWAALGEMLSLFLGRHEEAIEALDRSIEIAPWQVDGPADNAFFARGWANLCLGNDDRALADMEHVLTQTGPKRGPLAVYALLLIHKGRCAEGLDALGQYAAAGPLAGEPTRVLAYYDAVAKFRHCNEATDLPRAITLVNQALESRPDDMKLHSIKGMLLYRSGQFEKARTSLSKGLDASPGFWGYAATQMFLAMTHQRLDDHRAALTAYDDAIEHMQRANESRRPDLACLRRETATVLGAPGTAP